MPPHHHTTMPPCHHATTPNMPTMPPHHHTGPRHCNCTCTFSSQLLVPPAVLSGDLKQGDLGVDVLAARAQAKRKAMERAEKVNLAVKQREKAIALTPPGESDAETLFASTMLGKLDAGALAAANVTGAISRFVAGEEPSSAYAAGPPPRRRRHHLRASSRTMTSASTTLSAGKAVDPPDRRCATGPGSRTGAETGSTSTRTASSLRR